MSIIISGNGLSLPSTPSSITETATGLLDRTTGLGSTTASLGSTYGALDSVREQLAKGNENSNTTSQTNSSPSQAAERPYSADLDRHKETINAMVGKIAENNPTAVAGQLTNIINSGMDMGQLKPGHLEAVTEILKGALSQPGVSAATKAEVIRLLEDRAAGHTSDENLAKAVNELRGTPEETRINAERMEIAPTVLEQRIGNVLLDPQMSAEQKMVELESIKAEGQLSYQKMRDLIGSYLEKQGTGFVSDLDLEATRKLRADMSALDDRFGNGFLGLWENNDLQSALKSHENGIAERAEETRLNAERIEQEKLVAERVEAEKQAQAERDRQQQDAARQRELMEKEIGRLLLDQGVSSQDKMAELKRIQGELKLSNQQMRDIFGRQLDSIGTEFVKELSLQEVKKLNVDMDALNDTFANGIFGLQENNPLERALDRQESALSKQAEEQRLNAERMAREVGADKIKELLRGLDKNNFEANKQQIDALSRELGINSGEMFKEVYPDMVRQMKTSIEIGEEGKAQDTAFVMGQLAADMGINRDSLNKGIKASGYFSQEQLRQIRSQMAAGYSYQRED